VECDRKTEAPIPSLPNVASPNALALWAVEMVSRAEVEIKRTQAHQACMARLREEGVIR
jgi:hypothetical protein